MLPTWSPSGVVMFATGIRDGVSMIGLTIRTLANILFLAAPISAPVPTR